MLQEGICVSVNDSFHATHNRRGGKMQDSRFLIPQGYV
jgi:hypothetical protein